jgi:hypothetical protein
VAGLSRTDVTGRDRSAVEATLARYPNLDSEELEDLRHWFKREATSLDVGLIASNPDLAQTYASFRDAHLDPLGLRDYLVMVAVIAAFVGLVAAGYAFFGG